MLSRLYRVLFGLLLLAPIPAKAQAVQLDTVRLDPKYQALYFDRPTAPSAWCAPLHGWRRDPNTYNVWLDSLVSQPQPVAPDCAPGEATVLVRPNCVFSISEFLFTRARAQYVVLLCPPQGYGMPLTRSFPRASIASDPPE